jgi:hypothetical protein
LSPHPLEIKLHRRRLPGGAGFPVNRSCRPPPRPLIKSPCAKKSSPRTGK